MKAIRQSRAHYWRTLGEEVNRDPWGKPVHSQAWYYTRKYQDGCRSLGIYYFGAHGFCPAARSIQNHMLLYNRVRTGSSGGGQRSPDRPLGTGAQIYLRALWTSWQGRVSCPGPFSYYGLMASEVGRRHQRSLNGKKLGPWLHILMIPCLLYTSRCV